MLKKGDVIFIIDEIEKNISKLSVGYGKQSYYHCALYIGKSQIIESDSYKGVIISNIDNYRNNKILIARTDKSEVFLKEVVGHASSFIGYEYNTLFLPNTRNKLYCSELIHKAFDLANGEKFFKQHKLNYISPSDSTVSHYWLDFYGKLGLKVPQGEDGSHPNNLSLDQKFKTRFFIKKFHKR